MLTDIALIYFINVQVPADCTSSAHSDEKRMNRHDLCSSMSYGANCKSPQILRVAPKSDANITPLTINLSEYFTSTRLSLNSHEERLGNHAAEQLFNSMLHTSNKGYVTDYFAFECDAHLNMFYH